MLNQKRIALQENSCYPEDMLFPDGQVVVAGTLLIYRCPPQQKMHGKSTPVAALPVEHVCRLLRGVPKIKRLLISKYAESAVITSKGHHSI